MRTRFHRGAAPLRAAVAAALLAAGTGAALADDPAPGLERARQAYERNHWHEAYAAFAALADQGNPEAARTALQMWAWGPRLYGTRFEADERQIEQWRRIGSPLAAARVAR